MNGILALATNGAETSGRCDEPRRRLFRAQVWTAVAVLIALVLIWRHAEILQWLAVALIVERQTGPADAIWLDSGDDRFQTAADLYREDPRRPILIGRPFRDRVVELGILPPWEEVVRARLAQRGVPNEAVVFLGESCRDIWETGRALKSWLEANPGKRVLVLCERFRSRQLIVSLGQVLDPDEIARIDVRALPNYRYDETNWWKVRSGIKGFMSAWMGLACAWLYGEPTERPTMGTVEEYEARIAESFARTGR